MVEERHDDNVPTSTLARLFRTQRVRGWLLGAVAVIAVVWFLRAASVVTTSVAFAIFVAMLLLPIDAWVRRRVSNRLRWLGPVAAMSLYLLALALIVGAVWLVVDEVEESGQLGQYVEAAKQTRGQLESWLRSLGLGLDGSAKSSLDQRALEWLGIGAQKVVDVVLFLVIVFFLTLLMLLEAGRWHGKVERALAPRYAERIARVSFRVARSVRRYLAVRTLVSFVSGVVTALFLWAMDVDFWYLWGLLTFALNYVPNIGSILSAIPPILVAAIDPTHGWLWAVFVAVGLFAIEQFIGNFLDPRLEGRVLSLSPLVVLVGLLFWMWVWGAAGALLAVPMTAAIAVVCAQVPGLEPLARLMGESADEPAAEV